MGKLYDMCVFLKYIKNFKLVCFNKAQACKPLASRPSELYSYISYPIPKNYFEAVRHYVIS